VHPLLWVWSFCSVQQDRNLRCDWDHKDRRNTQVLPLKAHGNLKEQELIAKKFE